MKHAAIHLPIAILVLFALAGCGGGGGGGGTPPGDDPAPQGPDTSSPANVTSDIVLATVTLAGTAASQWDDIPALEGLVVGVGEDFGGKIMRTSLLTSDDAGREIEFAAGSTAGVDALFDRLTNGTDDVIGMGWHSVPDDAGGAGGREGEESRVLTDRHPRLSRADLWGASITRVVVRIDKIFVSSFGFQNFSTIEATITIRGNLTPFAGAIPIPDLPSLPGIADR